MTDAGRGQAAPWGALAAGTLLTAVVCALLSTDLLPLGIAGQWSWQLREVPLRPGLGALAALLALGAAVLAVCAAVAGGRRPRPLVCALVVALCVGASGTTMCGLVADDPGGPAMVAAATVSIAAMGYYSHACEFDSAGTLLRTFLDKVARAGWCARVQTHPPGPLLLSYLGRRALLAWRAPAAWVSAYLVERSNLTPERLYSVARNYGSPLITAEDMPMALLIGLGATWLACLLPIAAFLLAAGLWGQREGLVAALLTCAIPSALVFVPSIDGVAALLGLLAVAAWAWALRRGSWLLHGLTGLAMALALFWTAGLAVLAAPMAGMAVACGRGSRCREEGMEARRAATALSGALVSAAVLLAVYLALYLTTGYNFLANFLAIARIQRQVMEDTGRSYLVWLPMNLYDLALFTGPVLVALVVGAYGRARRLPAQAGGLAWGTLVCLALVLLSGSTRGEVGRIWLFLMPLFAVVAAGDLGRLRGKQMWEFLGAVTLCQIALALALYQTLSLVHP